MFDCRRKKGIAVERPVGLMSGGAGWGAPLVLPQACRGRWTVGAAALSLPLLLPRRLFFFTLVQNGERTFFHCLQTPKVSGPPPT